MSIHATDAPLEVFSTCPTMGGLDAGAYLRTVIDVARWSEENGCKGILVYSDNSQLDAWTVSHAILQNTRTLCPLVAVQPVYMHPYTVAKTLATIGWLYGRRVYLNMVAGGFKNDLAALDDQTPHDQRYQRLAEYVHVITHLLAGAAPVSLAGQFYRVDKLKLTPPLAPELQPGLFVSGSSEAGLAAARAIGATAIKYPRPAREESVVAADGSFGIRVGIIARAREADAWDVAHARFPEDRKGQLTRQLASKVSDSVWHKELADRAERGETDRYWLVPFHNYQTMCPYLVGSYDQVGEELARYLQAGHRTVILDIPPSAEELQHTNTAFAAALEGVGAL
ncbi:MAG TPA: LLM class flavin-dependent oxidoreductase [Vicinamibacteria bacterium]